MEVDLNRLLHLIRKRDVAPIRRLLILPVVALLVWQPVMADARGAPDSFADLAERLLPAVVNISTTQKVERPGSGEGQEGPQFQFPEGSPFRDFFDRFNRRPGDQPARRVTSLGSGFIIDATGFVVTNNHVIEGADKVTVILHEGEKFEAEVIGKDKKTDLALLKIDPGNQKLTAVEFGASDEARVGDWVIAIGNPLGLGGTVTAGIISARGRDIRSGPYDDYIQTDAPINRGNSGGPLFDMNGAVVGINTAILSPSGGSIGIGFSVPANIAKNVIGQLKEFGTTRRGWLGVQIQTVSPEIAESLGLKAPSGALVAGVLKNSPAEAAGVKQGDVIIGFDKREVSESRKLPRMVAETDVGKDVAVKVWRDGAEVNLTVRLGELEKVDQASLTTRGSRRDSGETSSREIDALGLALSPITPELTEKYKIEEDMKGVVITDVQKGSDAEERRLRPGDIVVEVGQVPVSSPGEVAAQVEKAREKGRKVVLLLVDKDGDMRFIPIKIK
ncbi:MAG: Do family serine endopeptidase [Alphaproteobacteria bacterium]|nr:Do family serine endopeptidase [Alphaproteobacteria bacterium]